jgi:chromosome partitioning protein
MAATAAAKVDTGGVDRPLLVCVSYARIVWPVREAKVSVRMRNTITVMNAKGGVGKSTLVLALAETLATYHGKRVLVIDADAQASVSHMLARAPELEAAQSGERTIVDYLIAAVLRDASPSWQDFVIPDVSDVDDARSIALIASDTDLTLFEREVSKGDHEAALRRSVGALLAEAGQKYDLVLVDSAPGLSVLTECFLREAHFYMSPTRPDEISIRGLGFLREFKQRNPEMGFGNNLGVIINMKDMLSPRDEEVDRWLRRDPEHYCFHESIPRVTPLQATGAIAPQTRSYWAKYPGETGGYLRRLTHELLHRLASVQGDAPVTDAAAHMAMAEEAGKRGEGKMRAMWSTWKERRTTA